MSGFEIYTKREQFAWDIACMDISVTFVALTTIFSAFFSVFTVSYSSSYIYILQMIAIPLALLAVWGRTYKLLRWAGILLVGVVSFFYLEVNLYRGVLPWINSAIRLINKCYNINLQLLSEWGYASSSFTASINCEKISFLWILCVFELLFGMLILKVLKTGKGRCYVILAFLLPVILGIFCGKLPDVASGCFLIVAIIFFLAASSQREHGVPIRAMFSAAVILIVVWLGASVIESSIYEYKEENLTQYKEIKRKLIEARNIDIADFIPEQLKNIDIGKNEDDEIIGITMGIDWNKNLQELSSVNRSGEVLDEVVVWSKPTSPVYWSMFEGYVYTGEEWAQKGAEGVYDKLTRMKQYCVAMNLFDNDQIARKLDQNFQNNFKYTLNPGKMPEGMDFAEGFLFERKEGFCVHFATAATIVYQMCEKEARYVEGYRILPSDFVQQSDGSYKAIVTDYMAHAWCETYEEFSGWKVREHTISSGLRLENTTPTIAPTQEEATVTPTVTPSGIPQEEQPTVTPFEEKEPGGNTSGIGGEPKNNIFKAAWNVIKIVFVCLFEIMLGIALLCAVILLQQKIRRKRKLRKFRNKHVKKGILSTYRAVQELCTFVGLRDREMWRREHINQIAEQFPQLSTQEWEWLYDCAERTMFSNDLMLVTEQKQMYQLYQRLRKGILEQLTGGRKFWFLYGRTM